MFQPRITAPQFEKKLFHWYVKNGRDLPWRHTKDPYRIWVSEIMLQQTQVERVKEYYRRFFQEFPTVRALAKARWPQVLDAWRGLGYYRRARNLHAAAKMIVSKYKGKFPDSCDTLQTLPGVGEYTAAAIVCFAFGQDVPALDTNLHKVFRHVLGADFWNGLTPQERFQAVQKYISKGNGARFHHAMMDFGTWLSQAGHTHFHCPFEGFCSGIMFAPRKKNQKLIGQKVAIGIVIHDGKMLIARRKKGDTFGGYWEFPGGKVEKGEDERICLKREMLEELGIEVSVRPRFHRIPAEVNGKRYLLSFHRCSLLLGKPRALEVASFKWVKLDEVDRYKFPPANKEVFEILRKKKAMFRV